MELFYRMFDNLLPLASQRKKPREAWRSELVYKKSKQKVHITLKSFMASCRYLLLPIRNVQHKHVHFSILTVFEDQEEYIIAARVNIL